MDQDKELVKVRAEAAGLSGTVIRQATSLVVADNDSYLAASNLLANAKQAKKMIEGRMDPIIGPIRTGLDKLYAMKRELLEPFDKVETAVKEKMRVWQVAERDRVRREEQERQKAAMAAEQERMEALLRLEQARTAKQQDRAAEQVIAVEEAVEQVRGTVVEAPVRAADSQAKVVMKWRVEDMEAVLLGVLEGTVPMAAVIVDSVYVNGRFRAAKAEVAMWPGFEVYEDVQIASR